MSALLACAFGSLAHAQSTANTANTADSLDPIVITGQRLHKPGTVTVLDAAALSRQGAFDMQNMARYAPLISVPIAASGSGNVWDGAGNTGFNIRGVEGNRVSLALDGIALPDAAPKPDASTLNGFGIGRDYFDPETFRRVDIASGTTPTGAGTPGLGGAVSFVTKSPEDYVGAQRSRYADYKFGYDGSSGMRMHALTGAAASGSVKMLALLVHRDGEQLDSTGSAVQNPDDWDSDALLAKLSWVPAAGHRVAATVDAYRANHDRVYVNKQGASYPDGATQDSRTRRNRFSVEHQYSGAASLFDTLDSRVYVQDADVDDVTDARYITGAQPYQRHIVTGLKNRSAGLASNAARRFGAHTLFYGVNLEDLDTERPWVEDRVVLATGAHQVTNKNRMADTSTRTAGVFARADLAVSERLTVTPGVRLTWRQLDPNKDGYLVAVPAAANELRKEDDHYATPSLALDYALDRDLSVYAQYSRGTRLPTAAEMTGTYDSFSYTGTGAGYAVIGNADLKKETSNAVEIGIKGMAARGLRFQAALFQTDYDNFIEYAAQPLDPVNYPTLSYGLYRPVNLADARTWGAEASAELDIGLYAAALRGTRLTLAGGVQHSRARNLDTGEESELVSTLPKKASAILGWDDPGQRGGASFAVVHTGAKQARPDVVSGVTTTRFAVPSATVMDLTAYCNLGRHAELTLGVYNLGDRKYWDYASARGLAAGTTAVARADIERMARPGRYVAATFKLIY
jgi:hemoglobin/transferrin/lactoferrin receptor protein